MLINVIVIVLWAFRSYGDGYRFDYALDQTSKKLSVTLRKEQSDAVHSVTAGIDTVPLYRYQHAEGNFVLPCLFDPLRNVQGSIAH